MEVAEEKSKNAAARQFNVDARRIREWCTQKDQLKAMKMTGNSKSKRLKGGWNK